MNNFHSCGFSDKQPNNQIGYFEVYLKNDNSRLVPVKAVSDEDVETNASYITDTHEVEYIGRDNHGLVNTLRPEDRFIDRN